MIVHRLGTDTRLDYDWTDDAGAPVDVESAHFTIDGADRSTMLGTNGAYPISLHIPDDSDLTEGISQYRLVATASTSDDVIMISAGILRVKQ